MKVIILWKKKCRSTGIDFVSYAHKKLFSPLGIKDYLWNTNFYEDECLLMRTREHVYGNFPESSPYGYLCWINDIEKHKAFHAGGFGGHKPFM